MTWLLTNKFPIVIAMITGIVSSSSVHRKMMIKCSTLPLFNPWGFIEIYFWLLAHFIISASIFWWFFDLGQQTSFDIDFLLKAFLYGILFTQFISSEVNFSARMLEVKPLIDYIDRMILDVITAKEAGKTTRFWRDFQEELSSKDDVQVVQGLEYLYRYHVSASPFTEVAGNPDTQQLKLEKIRKDVTLIANEKNKADRANKIIEILQINNPIHRKSFPFLLESFDCTKTKNAYFS